MSLVLDHINGVPDDNRLENLRVVCPNCAATLDTHCGRKNRVEPALRRCKRCREQFTAKYRTHSYCSLQCARLHDRGELKGLPAVERRKVERPPYTQLLEEIERMGYRAVGRRYGVSDNAVRKWVRFYERQREREEREGDERAEAA
jgi:hypothetical protein